MRVSLRRRMQIAFLTAMLVTLVVGASFWVQSQEIERGILTTQLAIVEDLRGVQDLQRSVLNLTPGLLEGLPAGRSRVALTRSVGLTLGKVDDVLEAARRRQRQDKVAVAGTRGSIYARAEEALRRSTRVVAVYEGIRRELADLGRELDGGGARLPVIRNRLKDVVNALASLAEGRDRYLDIWSHRVKRRHELLERDTLLAVAIGLACGLLLLVFATPDVANPVKRFLVALREVRDANFRARVNVDSRHELADVAEAFNQTLDGLERLEQHRAREFRREREKFQQLADLVDEAVVLVDGKGRIVHLTNRAFAFFSLSSEVVGQDLERTALPDEIKRVLQNALHRGVRAVHHRVTLCPRAGSDEKMEIFLSTGIVEDAGGTRQNVVLVFRPVSAPLAWPAPA